MKKILVIGASGLVGSRFVELAKSKLSIIPVDENILDITNKESVDKFFKENEFDSVLNFAAITNVDGAEKERGDENGFTWKLNVIGPKNLAEACKVNNKQSLASKSPGKFLVQISTDFVFRGTENEAGPYAEDTTLPEDNNGIGWYGWTKNRAEARIRESGVRNAVVRIAYPFYGSKFEQKLDFAKNYLKVFDNGKLFPIFTDQTFTPLNIDDFVESMVKILNEEIEGTFHIVSSDTATPFDFVEYLLNKTRNVSGVVQKGSMIEFLKTVGRTPRPRLGGLKTEITEKRLGMKFKTWREMVDDFANKQ